MTCCGQPMLQKNLRQAKIFIVHEKDTESSNRKLIDNEFKAQEIVILEQNRKSPQSHQSHHSKKFF